MIACVLGIVLAVDSVPGSIQPIPPQGHARLIAERGARAEYSTEDRLLELKGGTGWIRTGQLFSDFTLSFDFRLTSLDAEAGVFIRTLVTGARPEDRMDDSVYRIGLPVSSSSPLVAERGKARVTKTGLVDQKPANDWRHLEVTAAGRQIRILMDGAFVSESEIDHFAGYILFQTRRGSLQLRDVTITPSSQAQSPLTGGVPPERTAGITSPRLIREVKPFYTMEAMQRQVQGVVLLKGVVLPDGTMGNVVVTRSLDPDLDQSAVATVRRWKFAPGTRNGAPIAVLVDVEMTFKLPK